MKKFKSIELKTTKITRELLIDFLKHDKRHDLIHEYFFYDRGLTHGKIMNKIGEENRNDFDGIINDFIILGAWLHWNKQIIFINKSKEIQTDERRSYV